ncbi:MAG: LysM peptidoglycan-binding domain-containing protein [Kiritimatiellae bacterium]|nr:LysM peptidoglycan-binding domain-containing protein [Kiritimatiellia bacterium]
MQSQFAGRKVSLVAVALLVALAAGCSKGTSRLERREEQDPLVRRARALRQAGDIEGALDVYHKALERRPGLGRAHLEAGLLYDEAKQDYVRAIYHYEAYLALRPDADKAEMVKELIRSARISYAASLPDRPSEAIAQIAELKQDNEKLRLELREARAAMEQAAKKAGRERAPAGQPAPAPGPASRSPAPQVRPAPRVTATSDAPPPPLLPPAPQTPGGLETPPPAPASPAVETYRVQRGDSLSSIAAKMYEDSSQWRRIFEANRATLRSPESIRVGQVLIIPR